QIGTPALAEPATEEESGRACHAEHQRDGDQCEEILVDEGSILAVEAVVDQPPAGHRDRKRRERRRDERHEGKGDHEAIAAEEGQKTKKRPHTPGGLAALRLFLNGLDDRVRCFAHAPSPIRRQPAFSGRASLPFVRRPGDIPARGWYSNRGTPGAMEGERTACGKSAQRPENRPCNRIRPSL